MTSGTLCQEFSQPGLPKTQLSSNPFGHLNGKIEILFHQLHFESSLIAIATAEALNIGIKSGMDPSVLARVFTKSTAQSTILPSIQGRIRHKGR
jgi:hypothetical protein